MAYKLKYAGEEIDTLLGKASTALQEHQDISGLATKEELSVKQDLITDLASIREGASKGASALQSVPEEYVTEDELLDKGYITKDEVPKVDLSEYAKKEDIPSVPTKTSELTNNSGFVTSDEVMSAIAKAVTNTLNEEV
jgi:hypothetical protein